MGVAGLSSRARPTREGRNFWENDPRKEFLGKEPAEARRAVDGLNLKLEAEAATAAQSLGQEREKMAALARDAAAAGKKLAAEHDRAEALATELAKAREPVHAPVAATSQSAAHAA